MLVVSEQIESFRQIFMGLPFCNKEEDRDYRQSIVAHEGITLYGYMLSLYPNENGNKKRYLDWYETYIGVVYKNALSRDTTSMPYLSGEIIYGTERCRRGAVHLAAAHHTTADRCA